MEHQLDNPVWHALTGPQAGFALGRGAARHYPRDMAPFSAINESTPAAYADLAAHLPYGLGARPDRHRGRSFICRVAGSGGVCEGEQLEEVVGGADHGPLGTHFFDAAQQELAEA